MTTYRASWPVTDSRTPLADIIGTASYDLGIMLAAEKLEPTGGPMWGLVYRDGPRWTVEIAVREQVRASSVECGSESGYKRHQRNGDAPCDACRKAAATVRQIRRLRAERAAVAS